MKLSLILKENTKGEETDMQKNLIIAAPCRCLLGCCSLLFAKPIERGINFKENEFSKKVKRKKRKQTWINFKWENRKKGTVEKVHT